MMTLRCFEFGGRRSLIRALLSGSIVLLVVWAGGAEPPVAAPSKAKGGALDATFGGDGMVRSLTVPVVDPPGNNDNKADAVALQPDGKIVAAGHGSVWPVAVLRYNPDGSLDAGFGSGGQATTDFGGSGARFYPVSLALQSDGKIVVAASVRRPIDPFTTAYDFAVARFNPDGSQDSGFGGSGFVTTHIACDVDIARALAVQPDGKIVVGGTVTCTGDDFALVRYNSDGSLDPGFGSSGMVRTDFGSTTNELTAIALQGDGKIVAAGSSGSAMSHSMVARYDPDGALDTGFGIAGVATIDFGSSNDQAYAVALQSDGKIVTAGLVANQSEDFAVARINQDGSLDSGFGSGGQVVIDFAGGLDEAHAVVVQTDGRILVGGGATSGTSRRSNGSLDFGLTRLLSDGTLDRGFGSKGEVTTDMDGLGAMDIVFALAVQADGRLVAAGSTTIPGQVTSREFALARYLP